MPDDSGERLARPADRGLELAEDAVYIIAGVMLLAGAIAVLVSIGYHLARDLPDGTEPAVTAALDGLLLVFILLELLAGVRATIVERKLVAEPFLVVGIIASIKEIVVAALDIKADGSDPDAFRETMVEIGGLGGLVLVLALASFLVRRKEREPTEDESG